MHAVIGLGNPGRQYEKTRHNIGFIIVDFVSQLYKIPFKAGKGDYYYAEISISGNRILYVKPTTFMNHSGRAVKHLLRYFPLKIDDLLIVCDDFNLPFAMLRYRSSGSDGGHNGLKSIILELNSENFNRLRFGIGGNFNEAIDHVLSRFNKEEIRQLQEVLPQTAESIQSWIDKGIDVTMNRYNRPYV